MIRCIILLTGAVLLMSENCRAEINGNMFASKDRRKNSKTIDSCRSSLSSLYNCLQLYARDNKNNLPAKDNAAGILELVKNGATVNDFVCVPYKGKRIKKIEDFEEERLPYLYFGGINLQSALKNCPKIVLMCDKPTTRHINVLLADGSIVELQPKRYNKEIKSCMDIIQLLDIMYNYPPKILKGLQIKAKRMDENIFGKKRRKSSKR